ncbi:MAG TPA: RimK/LysX family protein [Mariprofundaceae bacterium]|nr:RimK/LysX family protein [Mariprofundaceae bacterium]
MALITVGWREWVSLPDFGIDHIKAKIDTGARTSCLHAFSQERFTQAGSPWLRFGMHPVQRSTEIEVFCEAEIVDERMVSDSGGHREVRPIICSTIDLGRVQFKAEFSLTNRDSMRFRVLLGRTAMKERLIVDPGKSFLLTGSKAERQQ